MTQPKKQVSMDLLDHLLFYMYDFNYYSETKRYLEYLLNTGSFRYLTVSVYFAFITLCGISIKTIVTDKNILLSAANILIGVALLTFLKVALTLNSKRRNSTQTKNVSRQKRPRLFSYGLLEHITQNKESDQSEEGNFNVTKHVVLIIIIGNLIAGLTTVVTMGLKTSSAESNIFIMLNVVNCNAFGFPFILKSYMLTLLNNGILAVCFWELVQMGLITQMDYFQTIIAIFIVMQAIRQISIDSMEGYLRLIKIQHFTEQKQNMFFDHMKNPFIVLQYSDELRKVNYINEPCTVPPFYMAHTTGDNSDNIWTQLQKFQLQNKWSLMDEIENMYQQCLQMGKCDSDNNEMQICDKNKQYFYSVQLSSTRVRSKEIIVFIQFIDSSHLIELAKQKGKSSMMCSISHELLNPLNSLTEVTRRIYTKQSTQDDIEQLNKSVRLLGLKVRDIIVYAERQFHQLYIQIEEVNLKELLQEVYGLYSNDAAQKNLKYTLKVPLFPLIVKGDYIKLSQIVNNVISNAVKYTQRNGRVEIIVSSSFNKVTVQVNDNGVGFTANQIEGSKLAGIGLSITKYICEYLQYEFQIVSQQSIGTNITLGIPTIENNEVPEERPLVSGHHYDFYSKATQSPKGLHFLIVDDSEYNRAVIRIMLNNILKAPQITEAEDGKQAIESIQEIIKQHNIVVFMDVEMPVMNGIEATKWIREWKKRVRGQIIVVGVTAFATTLEKDKCVEAGMQYVYSKPLTIKQLRDLLSDKIGLSTQQEKQVSC